MPEKARTSRTIFSQVELGHPWLFALATILACAGCGGGSQGASDGGGADLAPFLGTWSCAGTQIEVCGAASHTDTTDFAIDIVKGTSPNGIAAEPAGDAGNTGGTANSAGALDWTVSGSTATIDSPMTLPTVPGSVGGTWTPTYSGGLLSRNGAALIWTTSGSAVYVNGVTETCSFTQSYECSTENASSGGDASVPVDAPSEKTTVAVSMGSGFACLVTDQSGIQCWGDDTYGELGNATGSSDGVPAPVTGLASGGASVSAGGNGSACAVTTLGSVVCWGASADGELGNGGSTSNTSVPTEVTGLTSGITAVSVGEGSSPFACALTSGGGVKCWGDDTYGELGDGSTKDSSVPMQVSVTCTRGSVCPDASTPSSPVPVDVTNLESGVKAISAGSGFACALTSGGGVKCWGDNTYGELGNGSTTSSSVPVQVTGLTSGVKSVSAGGDVMAAVASFACAVTSDGDVMCWGAYGEGELGIPSTTTMVPVKVAGLTGKAISVSAGDVSACAVMAAGSVECWGADDDGELGNGTTTENVVSTPAEVMGLTGVTSVSVGFRAACAVASGSDLWCWGANFSGQLGNGGAANSSVPVRVSMK